MDYVDSVLLSRGFQRTREPISFPIVVHGVPGCGKTSLIYHILEEPLFSAQSYGETKPPNLAGIGIQKAPSPLGCGFNILDEYLSGELFDSFDVVLSDPYQNSRPVLRAHYCNNISHRVGPSVCGFLNKFGYEISSAREKDTLLRFGDIFKDRVVGQIIAFEPKAIELLDWHNAPYKKPCEVRGAEFEKVTFVSASKDLFAVNCADLYISLTRATDELLILQPK